MINVDGYEAIGKAKPEEFNGNISDIIRTAEPNIAFDLDCFNSCKGRDGKEYCAVLCGG
jgi:hypothetical protein